MKTLPGCSLNVYVVGLVALVGAASCVAPKNCEQILASENTLDDNYNVCELSQKIVEMDRMSQHLVRGFAEMLTLRGIAAQGPLAEPSTETGAVAETEEGREKRKHEYLRFGKRKHEYLRFGKRKHEYLRFGRK
uniref:FMRFamide-like neuropeptides 14 n=1 Tax=Rhabditophanes sp. KR3021 TaxID=114890 RepID=A0AC35TFW7_9BILA